MSVAKRKNDEETELEVEVTKKPKTSHDKYIDAFAKGLAHLQEIDPSLTSIIEKSHFPAFFKEDVQPLNSFSNIGRGILAQQVSGFAAKAIQLKFKKLFIKKEETTEEELDKLTEEHMLPFPTPEQVVKCTVDELRAAGLSRRKGEYMIGLAQAFIDGTISDEFFASASDDEIVDRLVSIRGLGPWSADMFLLFGLRRMDVFTIGDLGVRRGFERYLQARPKLQEELKGVDWTVPLENTHCPGTTSKAINRKAALTPKSKKNGKAALQETMQMEWVASKFRPYRSAFQMVLWRYGGTDIDVVEQSG